MSFEIPLVSSMPPFVLGPTRSRACEALIIHSPFDFHTDCPRSGVRIKVRSYSATAAIEDVFDAVFEWMNRPSALEIAMRRRSDPGDGE